MIAGRRARWHRASAPLVGRIPGGVSASRMATLSDRIYSSNLLRRIVPAHRQDVLDGLKTWTVDDVVVRSAG